MSHGRLAARRAGGILCLPLALLLAIPATSSGQAGLPSASAAPLPAAANLILPPATISPDAAGAAKPADGCKPADKAKSDDAPKPFWTKVPPLSPYPHLSFRFIFPTGPG